METGLGGDAGALGVDDTGIEGAGGLLAGDGELDGRVRFQRPGVIEVQFWQVTGHEIGSGEAGVGIRLGAAGDGAGGADGVAHGLGAEVGGTGGALALAEIDGDTETVVAGMLHRLHLAQADTDLQAGLGTGGGLGGAGALAAGLRQQVAHDALQPVEALGGVVGVGLSHVGNFHHINR